MLEEIKKLCKETFIENIMNNLEDKVGGNEE